MRIIDVCDGPIHALGVSPDGRFAAAAAVGGWVGTCDLLTGTAAPVRGADAPCDQFAFAPDGSWVAFAHPFELRFAPLTGAPAPPPIPGECAGGVAVSADGRKLVAVRAGGYGGTLLSVWELPGMRPQLGYNDWPPFRRLAFSRNGEFAAGMWPGVRFRYERTPGRLETRFAKSGGLDYQYPPINGPVFDTPGFVGFSRDSRTCAFGWADEFHVLDLSTGTTRESRYVRASFRDGAFTGSGHHFATVDDGGVLRLWDVRTWQVGREYEWGCGPLTCVAFGADGTAGVCGTADGRLVQFDVDE
jgi:hypothetical protein